MSDNLKACPFCGSSDVHIVKDNYGNSLWWVACYNCGAESKPHKSIAEAVEAWNRRTPDLSAALEALAVEVDALTFQIETDEYRRGWNSALNEIEAIINAKKEAV
jgi:Lar family restriction alleviation protein